MIDLDAFLSNFEAGLSPTESISYRDRFEQDDGGFIEVLGIYDLAALDQIRTVLVRVDAAGNVVEESQLPAGHWSISVDGVGNEVILFSSTGREAELWVERLNLSGDQLPTGENIEPLFRVDTTDIFGTFSEVGFEYVPVIGSADADAGYIVASVEAIDSRVGTDPANAQELGHKVAIISLLDGSVVKVFEEPQATSDYWIFADWGVFYIEAESYEGEYAISHYSLDLNGDIPTELTPITGEAFYEAYAADEWTPTVQLNNSSGAVLSFDHFETSLFQLSDADQPKDIQSQSIYDSSSNYLGELVAITYRNQDLDTSRSHLLYYPGSATSADQFTAEHVIAGSARFIEWNGEGGYLYSDEVSPGRVEVREAILSLGTLTVTGDSNILGAGVTLALADLFPIVTADAMGAVSIRDVASGSGYSLVVSEATTTDGDDALSFVYVSVVENSSGSVKGLYRFEAKAWQVSAELNQDNVPTLSIWDEQTSTTALYSLSGAGLPSLVDSLEATLPGIHTFELPDADWETFYKVAVEDAVFAASDHVWIEHSVTNRFDVAAVILTNGTERVLKVIDLPSNQVQSSWQLSSGEFLLSTYNSSATFYLAQFATDPTSAVDVYAYDYGLGFQTTKDNGDLVATYTALPTLLGSDGWINRYIPAEGGRPAYVLIARSNQETDLYALNANGTYSTLTLPLHSGSYDLVGGSEGLYFSVWDDENSYYFSPTGSDWQSIDSSEFWNHVDFLTGYDSVIRWGEQSFDLRSLLTEAQLSGVTRILIDEWDSGVFEEQFVHELWNGNLLVQAQVNTAGHSVGHSHWVLIDGRSGERLWDHAFSGDTELGIRPVAGPDDGYFYFQVFETSVDSSTGAINQSPGGIGLYKILWQDVQSVLLDTITVSDLLTHELVTLEGQISGSSILGSDQLIDNEILIVWTYSLEDYLEGSIEGGLAELLRFNLETRESHSYIARIDGSGTVVSSTEIDGELSDYRIVNGELFVISRNEGIYRVEAESGQVTEVGSDAFAFFETYNYIPEGLLPTESISYRDRFEQDDGGFIEVLGIYDLAVLDQIRTVLVRVDASGDVVEESQLPAGYWSISVDGVGDSLLLFPSTGIEGEIWIGSFNISGNQLPAFDNIVPLLPIDVDSVDLKDLIFERDLLDLSGLETIGRVYEWSTKALLSSAEYVVKTTPDGLIGISPDVAITSAEEGRVISAADALAALKIAVGLNPNTEGEITPYQYYAADVNTDGRVSAADALAILKMAVGLDTAPDREWRFVREDADLSVTDRSNVDWDNAKAPSADSVSAHNYVAVLSGDVNGSWQPSDSVIIFA